MAAVGDTPLPAGGNRITADHRGPAVNIAVWSCFIVGGVTVLAKGLTKLARFSHTFNFRNLQVDDLLVFVALLFAAGQTLAVSRQVAGGLGEHISQVSPENLRRYQQAEYASQILYIGAIALAKGASFHFGMMLQPSDTKKMILKAFSGLTGLWAVSSVLAIAFQCHAPRFWETVEGQCIDQKALWTYIEAVNCFTDLSLTVILCTIVLVLQMRGTKYILAIVFATRLLIIIASSFRLLCIFNLYNPRNTPDWDATMLAVNVAYTTAIVMAVSLTVTCVPFLRPLMEALQPGWSSSDVRTGMGYGAGTYGKGTYGGGTANSSRFRPTLQNSLHSLRGGNKSNGNGTSTSNSRGGSGVGSGGDSSSIALWSAGGKYNVKVGTHGQQSGEVELKSGPKIQRTDWLEIQSNDGTSIHD